MEGFLSEMNELGRLESMLLRDVILGCAMGDYLWWLP
jgi:hypothetical protein